MAPHLELAELTRRLATQANLPKDGLIDSRRWCIPNNPHRHRDRRVERAMLRALTGPGSTSAEEHQALAQANCSTDARCRRLTCWICKHRAWRHWRRKIDKLIDTDIPAEGLSWVTIIIRLSKPAPTELSNLIAQFRNSLRSKSSGWAVKFIGRFEIDLLMSPDEFSPVKLATLGALGYDQRCERPTAVLHVHLFAVHPNLPRPILSLLLKRAFPGFRRTEVRPLRRDQSRALAFDNLTRYMLKSLPPASALPRRGSRLYVPIDPGALRLFNRILRSVRGRAGECVVGFADPPEDVLIRRGTCRSGMLHN